MSGIMGILAVSKAAAGGGSYVFAFDPAKVPASYTLTGSNKTATKASAGGTYQAGLGLNAMSVGDVTFFTVTSLGAGNAPGIGLGNISTLLTAELGSTTDSIGIYVNGNVEYNGVILGVAPFTFTSGDIIGVKRTSTTLVEFNKNGGAFSGFSHTISGSVYAGATLYSTSDATTGAP